MLLKSRGNYGAVIFRTKALGFMPCVAETERDLFHTRRQCSGFLRVQNYTRSFSFWNLVSYTLQRWTLGLHVPVQTPRQPELSLNTKQPSTLELARALSIAWRCLWSTIRWWDVPSHGPMRTRAPGLRPLAGGHLGKWRKGVNNSSAAAWLLWLRRIQRSSLNVLTHWVGVCVILCGSKEDRRTVGFEGTESSTTITAHSFQGRVRFCMSVFILSRAFKGWARVNLCVMKDHKTRSGQGHVH